MQYFMSFQRTIFGTEELLPPRPLKDMTFDLLEELPFFAECQHAHLVALQLAKDMHLGIVSNEESITMRKSTYHWIVQNIPNIERYIREFKMQEERRRRGHHIPIEPDDSPYPL